MKEVLLSKWWKTPSAKAALRRVAKARKDRIRDLRARAGKIDKALGKAVAK